VLLYLVETKNEVFVSPRKLDAVYKHVEFQYGKARYYEVDDRYWVTDKKIIQINNLGA
jgi:hypothetical protein